MPTRSHHCRLLPATVAARRLLPTWALSTWALSTWALSTWAVTRPALATLALATLALATGCTSTPPPAPAPPPPSGEPAASGYSVEWVGELRSVHRDGDASARMDLQELADRPGAFALGPLAGLRGEITVIDGEAYVARADGGAERVERGFDHRAAFLVFGQVAAWQDVPVPATVGTIAELEAWLPGAAAAAGLRSGEPFPFQIETSGSRVESHVIARTEPGDLVDRPHRELMRAFTLEGEPATILGVHSTAHGGVFTHHGQATHLHLVAADGRRSGHVDELRLAPGAVARLPVP